MPAVSPISLMRLPRWLRSPLVPAPWSASASAPASVSQSALPPPRTRWARTPALPHRRTRREPVARLEHQVPSSLHAHPWAIVPQSPNRSHGCATWRHPGSEGWIVGPAFGSHGGFHGIDLPTGRCRGLWPGSSYQAWSCPPWEQLLPPPPVRRGQRAGRGGDHQLAPRPAGARPGWCGSDATKPTIMGRARTARRGGPAGGGVRPGRARPCSCSAGRSTAPAAPGPDAPAAGHRTRHTRNSSRDELCHLDATTRGLPRPPS